MTPGVQIKTEDGHLPPATSYSKRKRDDE